MGQPIFFPNRSASILLVDRSIIGQFWWFVSQFDLLINHVSQHQIINDTGHNRADFKGYAVSLTTSFSGCMYLGILSAFLLFHPEYRFNEVGQRYLRLQPANTISNCIALASRTASLLPETQWVLLSNCSAFKWCRTSSSLVLPCMTSPQSDRDGNERKLIPQNLRISA